MPVRRVLLATSADFPALGDDEQLVLPDLAARGIDAAAAIWTDPAVDWSGAVVVVRSTWDYTQRHAEFLAWLDRIALEATVWNPPGVIRRNTDKRYLADLAGAGVPVVPTAWIDRGTTGDVRELLAERRWAVAVVKPAVSVGAQNTIRVTPETAAAAQHLADAISSDRDVMLQPYLHSVERYGERSLIYLGGQLSHAVRKAPMLAGATSPDDVEPAVAAAEEIALAERALEWVGSELLYARVDIARLDDGTPVIMELELTEPRLFLRYAGAADRFAAAISAAAAR
ncbi:MAG: hypothetical protein QOG49_17 [Frankiaceae bacterium]|jgi:glutathione synthase/RimK-type ligase-like ATP-grasp enzyme|nr:hypothetical protein [Frankiaceae bacterium]